MVCCDCIYEGFGEVGDVDFGVVFRWGDDVGVVCGVEGDVCVDWVFEVYGYGIV